MSTFFSANQYENAYDPKKMGNWEIPHPYVERPPKNGGFTQVIANDRGHILPYVRRSSSNPWGNFVGTWQLPAKLPGPTYNLTTSRGEKGHLRLTVQAEDSAHYTSGRAKNDHRLLISEVGMNLSIGLIEEDITGERRKPNFAELPPIANEPRSPPRPLSGTGSPTGSFQNGPHVTLNVSPSCRKMHSPLVYPKTNYPQADDIRDLTPLSDTHPECEKRSPVLSQKGGIASPIRADISFRGSVSSSQGNANMDVAFAL